MARPCRPSRKQPPRTTRTARRPSSGCPARTRPRARAPPDRRVRAIPLEYSEQPCFVGPRHVGRERFASFTALEVTAKHPFDVIGRLLCCHLQTPELATEFRLGAHLATEVHLECLLVAVRALLHHALEADICDLETRAGVRAAVHVDGDRR